MHLVATFTTHLLAELPSGRVRVAAWTAWLRQLGQLSRAAPQRVTAGPSATASSSTPWGSASSGGLWGTGFAAARSCKLVKLCPGLPRIHAQAVVS